MPLVPVGVFRRKVGMGEGTAFGCRGSGDTVWEGIPFRSRVVGGKEGEHSFYPVPGI